MRSLAVCALVLRRGVAAGHLGVTLVRRGSWASWSHSRAAWQLGIGDAADDYCWPVCVADRPAFVQARHTPLGTRHTPHATRHTPHTAHATLHTAHSTPHTAHDYRSPSAEPPLNPLTTPWPRNRALATQPSRHPPRTARHGPCHGCMDQHPSAEGRASRSTPAAPRGEGRGHAERTTS